MMIKTIFQYKIMLILIICISALSKKSNGQVIHETLKSELLSSDNSSFHNIIGENQNGLYYNIRNGYSVELRKYNSKLDQNQIKQFKFPIKIAEFSFQFESFIISENSIFLIAYASSGAKTTFKTQYYSFKLDNQTLEITGEKIFLCEFDQNFTHGLFFWAMSNPESQHYDFDKTFFFNNTLCSPNKKYFALCLAKNNKTPTTEKTYRFIVFDSECNKEWDKNITFTTVTEKYQIKKITIDDDKTITISALDIEDIMTPTKDNNFYYISVRNDGEQVLRSTIKISGKYIFSAKHACSINKVDYIIGIYGEDSHTNATGILTVNLTDQKYPEIPRIELNSLTSIFLNREIILDPTKKPVGFNIVEKFKFHIESIYFDTSQNIHISFERFKVQRQEESSITCYNLGITTIQLNPNGNIISTNNIVRNHYHWTATSCSFKSIKSGSKIYFIYNELTTPNLSNSIKRNNDMNLIIAEYNMESKSVSKSILAEQDSKTMMIFNPFYAYYSDNSKLFLYGISMTPYPKNQLIGINLK